ncbi:MAG: ABC transporter substrate-binding protein, partial [Planctomycetales bacterium]|nr:ABC transporter substrate-binding protein [Planctomycetales bacterium]
MSSIAASPCRRRALSLPKGVAASSLLLALSCGGSAARDPDTLVVVQGADAKTLDPHETTDNVSGNVELHLFDNLLRFDEELVPRPELAESWEVSPDGLAYTFRLRTGVPFHDGSPCDAGAVRACFARLLDEKVPRKQRSLYAMIASVEAPDPGTVVFRLRKPFGAFLAHLCHTSAHI